MSQNGLPYRAPAAGFANLAAVPAEGGWGAAMLVAGVAVTAARLLWLAVQPADLYPDEAQYWFWAQHPAFGYYSKPPLVAWVIGLTTAIAGDGEFGVRLAAPLLHAAAAGFVYGLGARLYNPRTGFWAGVAYLTLPGVSVSACIMSTDAVLLPCWAAALYAFVRAREDGGIGWWLAAGVACGVGLLAKYAMAYWLLSAFGWVLLARGERRHLPGLAAAALVALLILSPNLVWNWQHGFVSFLHLRDNADLAGRLFHPQALAEFFAAQFGVFGPLFCLGLLWLSLSGGGLAEPPARLLAAFAWPTLALMLALSLLSRAQPNWAAPAYVAGVVLVVGWAFERGRRGFVVAAVAVDLLAALALFAGPPALHAAGFVLPARYDPLHRLRGWRELGREIGAELAAHPGLQLLADDRDTLAAMIYYVEPHPVDAAKWRLSRSVKDEWDLTNDLDKYRGRSFLLVSVNNLADEMRPHFAGIERLRQLTIPIGPGAARRYALYVARDFQGYERAGR